MVHSTDLDKQHTNGRVEDANIASTIAAEDQAQFEGSSDGEGEKTARERLKKTSLAGLTQQSSDPISSGETHPLSQSTTIDPEHSEGGNGSRGRPAKKRSFEDLTRGESVAADAEMSEQPLPKSGHHKRMRSRDVASGEHVVGKFEADAANSVREESDMEAQQTPGGPGVLIDAPLKEGSKQQESEESKSTPSDRNGQQAAPETKSTPELTGDTKTSAIKATSAFTNTSTASPFGAISSTKQQSGSISSSPDSRATPTSPSAFASSGLSAFAASEKSPFGSSTNKTSGGFGGASSTGTFASASGGGFGGVTPGFVAKQSLTSFGGGTGFGGSSGFGSSSRFGSSTGFGAPKPFGTGISSFAGSGGGASSFGTGKPIGATRQENEDGSENSGDDENDQTQTTEAKPDDRFHEQDVATGEEKENTIFVCRAKLYTFEREWKERGVGTFKINVRYVDTALSSKDKDEEQDSATSTDGEEDKPNSKDRDFSGDDLEGGADDSFATTERRARLIMRTDGVHRVILNTPVFKDMHIGEQDGSEPSGKTMHLTGLEDGKLRPFKIKIGKEEVLKDLYWKVVDLRTDLA